MGQTAQLTESPVVGQYPVQEIQASGLRGCHLCSVLCPAHSGCDISQISEPFITVKLRFYGAFFAEMYLHTGVF